MRLRFVHNCRSSLISLSSSSQLTAGSSRMAELEIAVGVCSRTPCRRSECPLCVYSNAPECSFTDALASYQQSGQALQAGCGGAPSVTLEDSSSTAACSVKLSVLQRATPKGAFKKGEDYLTCEGHPSLENGCVIVAMGEPLETLQVHGHRSNGTKIEYQLCAHAVGEQHQLIAPAVSNSFKVVTPQGYRNKAVCIPLLEDKVSRLVGFGTGAAKAVQEAFSLSPSDVKTMTDMSAVIHPTTSTCKLGKLKELLQHKSVRLSESTAEHIAQAVPTDNRLRRYRGCFDPCNDVPGVARHWELLYAGKQGSVCNLDHPDAAVAWHDDGDASNSRMVFLKPTSQQRLGCQICTQLTRVIVAAKKGWVSPAHSGWQVEAHMIEGHDRLRVLEEQSAHPLYRSELSRAIALYDDITWVGCPTALTLEPTPHMVPAPGSPWIADPHGSDLRCPLAPHMLASHCERDAGMLPHGSEGPGQILQVPQGALHATDTLQHEVDSAASLSVGPQELLESHAPLACTDPVLHMWLTQPTCGGQQDFCVPGNLTALSKPPSEPTAAVLQSPKLHGDELDTSSQGLLNWLLDEFPIQGDAPGVSCGTPASMPPPSLQAPGMTLQLSTQAEQEQACTATQASSSIADQGPSLLAAVAPHDEMQEELYPKRQRLAGYHISRLKPDPSWTWDWRKDCYQMWCPACRSHNGHRLPPAYTRSLLNLPPPPGMRMPQPAPACKLAADSAKSVASTQGGAQPGAEPRGASQVPAAYLQQSPDHTIAEAMHSLSLQQQGGSGTIQAGIETKLA